jgi:hypothetical protein
MGPICIYMAYIKNVTKKIKNFTKKRNIVIKKMKNDPLDKNSSNRKNIKF